jgi:hypothetical protein
MYPEMIGDRDEFVAWAKKGVDLLAVQARKGHSMVHATHQCHASLTSIAEQSPANPKSFVPGA